MIFLRAEKPKDAKMVEAISRRIMSLEYEASDSGQASMKLEVDNSDQSLFSYEGFFDADALILQWGSEGNMVPPHKIRIKKISGFFTLTIEGTNEMWKGDQVPSRRLWEEKEVTEIVRAVAGEMGYPNPDIQTPEEMEQMTRQQYEPNARFLQRLASECGYAFWIDSNLHWRSRDAKAAPGLRIVFRGTADPGTPGIVIGEPSVKFEFSRSKPGKVTGEGVKDKTKEAPPTKPVPRVSVFAKMKEEKASPRLTTTRWGTIQYSGERAKASTVFSEGKELPAKQEAKVYAPGGKPGKAAGLWRGKQDVQGIEVTIVGSGGLAVGGVVELANFGPINDGKWYARKIKHRVDGQGFSQALTLSRSSGKKPGAAKKPVKGDVNRAADANAKGTAGTADTRARIRKTPFGTFQEVSRPVQAERESFFTRFKKEKEK